MFKVLTSISQIERYLQNKAKLNSGYSYEPNNHTTANVPTMYGQFNPSAPMNPQQLSTRPPLPIAETSYDHSQTSDAHSGPPRQLDYPLQQVPHPPNLRAPLTNFNTTHNVSLPLPSRLRPPAHYHRPTQSHSSTLPPIHLHTDTAAPGGETMREREEARTTHQNFLKLPNIHSRKAAYAGRPNRTMYVVLTQKTHTNF